MCGIIGYTGEDKAAPLLIEGLKNLEYRGYDSAGIAVRTPDGEDISIIKAKGRLSTLSEKTGDGNNVEGFMGIGHTRWATHGEPSEANSHPHRSSDGMVVIVHNGIIENHAELKDKLKKRGYTFSSQTDTEVAANLIAECYKANGNRPIVAISEAMGKLVGSYAFGIMFSDIKDKIFAARKDSPLIVGVGDNCNFIASDVPAILSHTNRVYYMDNCEIAAISENNVEFYNMARDRVQKEITVIDWDSSAAGKCGYDHFMLKEIEEQPTAMRNTLCRYLTEKGIDISQCGLTEEQIKNLNRIYIVACGSAYHVGLVAEYVFEKLAGIPVETDTASEFRYREPVLDKNSMMIVISQSGETADSLAALRLAKEKGIHTLGIVNVIGSAIAREADAVMYTYAGPEIAVATTKAYSTQLSLTFCLATEFAHIRGAIDADKYNLCLNSIRELPDKIMQTLECKNEVREVAQKIKDRINVFFIGRGVDYACSTEGSLKLKEVSYVLSEAYAAGELKHGTISLIEKGTPVIAVVNEKELFDKTASNIAEVRSRGAYVIAVSPYAVKGAEVLLEVPEIFDLFSPALSVIPLQLLAYYVGTSRGIDVDKPRNLAKSVTVE